MSQKNTLSKNQKITLSISIATLLLGVFTIYYGSFWDSYRLVGVLAPIDLHGGELWEFNTFFSNLGNREVAIANIEMIGFYDDQITKDTISYYYIDSVQYSVNLPIFIEPQDTQNLLIHANLDALTNYSVLSDAHYGNASESGTYHPELFAHTVNCGENKTVFFALRLTLLRTDQTLVRSIMPLLAVCGEIVFNYMDNITSDLFKSAFIIKRTY